MHRPVPSSGRGSDPLITLAELATGPRTTTDPDGLVRIPAPPEGRGGVRWRDYRTSSGRRPVKRFIAALPIDDQAAIAAAMKDIQIH